MMRVINKVLPDPTEWLISKPRVLPPNFVLKTAPISWCRARPVLDTHGCEISTVCIAGLA
eukprot:105119-Pleurochrysis_carterae.AAC.1